MMTPDLANTTLTLFFGSQDLETIVDVWGEVCNANVEECGIDVKMKRISQCYKENRNIIINAIQVANMNN